MKHILEFNDVLHACSRLAMKHCERYFVQNKCEVGYLQTLLLKQIAEVEEKPNMSIRALGALMGLDRTTVNRNAEVLVAEAMLYKASAGYNNRSKLYYLTDKGRLCLKNNLHHLNACSTLMYELSSLPKRMKEMREFLNELLSYGS